MPHFTLSETAKLVDAELHGTTPIQIVGVCSIENPKAGHIAMAETAEQLSELCSSDVAAILHSPELTTDGPALVHPQPRIIFAKLLQLFHPERSPQAGIHTTAVVDPRAQIDPSASIGPHCLIGPRAVIGSGVQLQAYVSIGEDAEIGSDCQLFAHVVIGQSARLGRDCRLEPWAQVGRGSRLGDSVDLGAHTSLAQGVTVESGAKFDNLVVVGPRSEIGAGSLLVGQSSVDRDAKLHPGVVLAGQSAVGPEAELVSGVQLGGRSWALGKLDKAGPYLGNPARPLKEELRRQALLKRQES